MQATNGRVSRTQTKVLTPYRRICTVCERLIDVLIRLLEWDESGGVGSTDTWSSVLDWLVGDGELSEVVSDHLRSDFDLVEDLSIVDTDDRANHFWDDDHISEMCLDWCWLFVCLCIFLCLSEFLDESHWLSLESSLELSPCSSVEYIHELF